MLVDPWLTRTCLIVPVTVLGGARIINGVVNSTSTSTPLLSVRVLLLYCGV